MAVVTKMIMMECITNLHVGDGDINYNIVDNEVQKDSITKLPTIHSSGVKGAFRAYFETSTTKDEKWITDVFGSKPSEKADEKKSEGKVKFFSGDCFALAMRNSSFKEDCKYPFSLVTTEFNLKQMASLASVFNINDVANQISSGIPSNLENLMKQAKGICCAKGVGKIEGQPVTIVGLAEGMKTFFKKNIVFSSWEQLALLNNKFIEDYQLPVNARNQLENKISKNLWYEEFVPHHSVFYTFVRGEDKFVSAFCKEVNGHIIQFGANASIGFGLMKLKVVGVE